MKGWQKHRQDSWRKEKEEELRSLRRRRESGHRIDRPHIPGFSSAKSR